MVAPLAALGVTAAGKLAAGIVGQVSNALDPKAQSEAKARKTAQDFESMFLEQTLEHRLQHLGEEGGFEGLGGFPHAGGDGGRSLDGAGHDRKGGERVHGHITSMSA